MQFLDFIARKGLHGHVAHNAFFKAVRAIELVAHGAIAPMDMAQMANCIMEIICKQALAIRSARTLTTHARAAHNRMHICMRIPNATHACTSAHEMAHMHVHNEQTSTQHITTYVLMRAASIVI